jgi:hypothetical protein
MKMKTAGRKKPKMKIESGSKQVIDEPPAHRKKPKN